MAAGGGKESYKFSATSFKKSSYESKRERERWSFNFGVILEELFELVQLSDVPLDNELFKVVSTNRHLSIVSCTKQILELLKENVAPSAIVQVLKALRYVSTNIVGRAVAKFRTTSVYKSVV